MGDTLQPAGSTCTTINERPEYASLPPGTKGYLQEKIEFALKTPDVIPVKLRDGSVIYRMLMQVAMAGPMIAEERAARFLWQYKAEVSFDMGPSVLSGGLQAPIPFLSNDRPQGSERRRSLNPFPPGAKVGLLRRPDVIIVKSPAVLWPGRGNVDREHGAHADNLLRLVEVKFPGDQWGTGQEEAYQAIAGDFKTRMTVIDVSDCNGDLKKVPIPAPIPAPKTQDEKQRQRVPIRTVTPVPQPVFYEDWWSKTENAIAPVWDAVQQGYSYVSTETSTFLHQHAAWMFTAGQWVCEKAQGAWVWVDETGHEIFRYTAAQLKAGWQAIVQMTDLTWELLKAIDWAQVGVTLLKWAAIAVAVVAGVAIVILLLPELLAILAALCAIIAAGAEAIIALAATLEVTEAAGGALALSAG